MQEKNVCPEIQKCDFWINFYDVIHVINKAAEGKCDAGDADKLSEGWERVSRTIALTYLELKAEESRCAEAGVAMGFAQQ